MQETRVEYEQIVRELDETNDTVYWPKPQICLPLVRKVPKESSKPKHAVGLGSSCSFHHEKGVKKQMYGQGEKVRFLPQSNATEDRTHVTISKSHCEVQTDSLQVTSPLVTSDKVEGEASDLKSQENQMFKEIGLQVTFDGRHHELTCPGKQQHKEEKSGKETTTFIDENKIFMPKEAIDASGRPSRVVQSSVHSNLTATTLPSPKPHSVTHETITQGRVSDCFHSEQTSVWDSSNSGWLDPGNKELNSVHNFKSPEVFLGITQHSEGHRPEMSKKELLQRRKNVAMELLWMQQAIISRKNVRGYFFSTLLLFQMIILAAASKW